LSFDGDEAHATGIFGLQGSGLVEEEEVTEDVDLIMGTFSKALGASGLCCLYKSHDRFFS